MTDPIDEIERLRARNNTLWMSILRTALTADPVSTKAIIAAINRTDQEISVQLKKLAE